jgi:hypothetical protein
MQKTGRESAGCVLAVSDFKAVERGQGNAVSAVEMVERLKEVGFHSFLRIVGDRISVDCDCRPVDVHRSSTLY